MQLKNVITCKCLSNIENIFCDGLNIPVKINQIIL